MMQSLDLHRTIAQPAAAQALPGMRPACAPEPRAPGFVVSATGKGNRTGRAFGVSGTASDRGRISGRHRRDKDNQRGGSWRVPG